MKCPKCGYHSFDHLNDCKKCGNDLVAHKEKFNLRGFYAPGQSEPVAAVEQPVAESDPVATDSPAGPSSDNVDFGFDFLDDDNTNDSPAADINDNQGVNIDRPFDVGSEAVPADTPKKDDEDSGFSF